MSEFADSVRRRALQRCEYCLVPQTAFRRPFHIEHIVALQHGGLGDFENLALACWQCNFKKGPNLAGIDPETGAITALFHPRKSRWEEHFEAQAKPDRIEIHGLTSTGRATVQVLGMNDEMRQMLRYELWREGLFTSLPGA